MSVSLEDFVEALRDFSDLVFEYRGKKHSRSMGLIRLRNSTEPVKSFEPLTSCSTSGR